MQDNSIIKKLRILAIIEETTNAKTFVLEPLDNWVPEYQPGQFITLVFSTPHGEKRRAYSFSSAPGVDGALSVTVKKVDNGEFSRYMLDYLKTGDVLFTSGIAGMFTLPEKVLPAHHFCFIAAGSGIVPCYSLIKTLLQETQNKITLIYSNKNESDTLFLKSLQILAEVHKTRFEIRFLFSANSDIYRKRLSKWLLELIMEQMLETDLGSTLFYICGPFDYMQTIEITLRIRVPKENIKKENFSTLPRLTMPEPPDKDPHVVKIHLNGKIHALRVQYPNSILYAAKKQGIELPYSCEAGRCSSCIATCSHGKIWMSYNEVLVDKEVKQGRVLVCQAFPIGGDAEITYDS